jgi:hypothetical protein
LGDFLNDHLAAELTAHDVWDFLRETCGFRPADWSRDQSVHARIHDESSRYRDGITADHAPLAEIGRSAARVIAELLATPDGPAVVTVAADAGAVRPACSAKSFGFRYPVHMSGLVNSSPGKTPMRYANRGVRRRHVRARTYGRSR